MHATAEKHYLVGHSSGGQGLVNNHFILNNEPRKEKHLENLESVLVFESLVYVGECVGVCLKCTRSPPLTESPGHCLQSARCSQLETAQANFPGSSGSSGHDLETCISLQRGDSVQLCLHYLSSL